MATDHELRLRERLTRLRTLNLLGGTRLSGELEKLQRQLERIQAAPTDEEIWRSVELARHQDRPYTLDYVERLFDDWVELHGDRGSGGAIATALADRVLMHENAIYTVISPEGCAAILWRDAGEAKKAAAAFKPDAVHCLELGVIDGIVPEPEGGAHTDPDGAARLLGESLTEALEELESIAPDDLKRRRRARFRSLGVYA